MRADKELVRKAYEAGEGTYKKLSEKYEVSQGTIKSWAKQDRDNNDPWIKPIKSKPKTKNQNKKVEPKVEVEKSKGKNNKTSKAINEKIVKGVIDNESLTDEQQLFCIYYIKCFNATKAYQKAYGCDYTSAMSNGSRLLRNDKVRDQIERLKQGKLNRALLSEDDIFQKYMDIAFSDITDYVDHGTENIPLIDTSTNKQKVDEEGNLVFYKRNYIHFKEGKEIDGSLVSEVSQGKDGVKVKLQDKMKALQWLTDHMDLLTTHNKEKLQLEKDKLEHTKGKDNKTDKPIEIVIKRKEDKR